MGSTTSPTISLSASIVHPGETVTVTGQGFAIADSVTITIDSSYYAIGTLSCDSNGNCSGSAIIPNNSIVQGPHQVTGAGTSSYRVSSLHLQQVAQARLSNSTE